MNEIAKTDEKRLTAADLNGLFNRFIAFADVKQKSAETYSRAIKQTM